LSGIRRWACPPSARTPALGVVHRLLAQYLAALAGLRGALCATGAVTIIQRFGSAANLNVHFHCLALDGVYRVGRDGRPRFVAATAPAPARLQALLAAMIARLMRLFVRRGVVVAEADRAWVEDGPDQADDADMAAADGHSAFEPQVKTCSPSCWSSLQPLGSWGLRQTRGGSVPRASTIRVLRPT
jgi:hypothetical protein